MAKSNGRIVVSRHDDGVLVDEFCVVGPAPRRMFDAAKKLSCVVKGLPEGALVLDYWVGENLIGDPVTIAAESADWFLFEFLQIDRDEHERLVQAWRNEYEEQIAASPSEQEKGR